MPSNTSSSLGGAGGPVADFWRNNGNLPDEITDTTDAIRRLGNVSIGGDALTDASPTVNTPSANNNYVQLDDSAINRGQFMFGNSPLSYYLTRTVPTVVNNFIDIGSINLNAGAHNLRISIVVSDGGFSVTKIYNISIPYNGTTAAWRSAVPLFDSGAWAGAQDFELLVNSNSNIISFRLRRTLGAVVGTAHIRIEYTGSPSAVLTESVATGTDATVYAQFSNLLAPDFWRSGTGTTLPNGSTDETENIVHNGNVGFGITNPTTVAARFDINGAGILRPVTVTNRTANGAIGTAVATVDIASSILLQQTTANIASTIPNPTLAQAGRILTIVNIGNTQAQVNGVFLTPSKAISFIWTGTAWVFIGNDSGSVTLNASRAAVATDHLKTLLSGAAAVTLTINTNTFQYGLFRVRQGSAAGIVTIAAGAGMTLTAPFGAATLGVNGADNIVEVVGTRIFVT